MSGHRTSPRAILLTERLEAAAPAGVERWVTRGGGVHIVRTPAAALRAHALFYGGVGSSGANPDRDARDPRRLTRAR